MLKKVLSLISTADYLSRTKLSRQLQISEALLKDLITHLERMGYIREALPTGGCDRHCHGCPLKQGCPKLPVKMFFITDKGRSLLAQDKSPAHISWC